MSALVLFSGGQDSTTCLAWALERFTHVETLGFDYGQRHIIELSQRARLRARLSDNPVWKSRLGEDLVLKLSAMQEISRSALTEDMVIEMGANGLPTTFVPGRNLLFMTYAAVVAYRRGIKHVVTGVCETDYSGYPDCRDDTVKALQATLNLGMEARFVIHTPLMWLDKAATWGLAQAIGGDDLVELIRTDTHTCYMGDRSHLHVWGYGCGSCPACYLRRVGYQKFRAEAFECSGADA